MRFRRNAQHCISPCAIVVCVCVFVYVYIPRLWTSGKRFEIESFSIKLREITTNISFKSLTQIGLQIPRWHTKWWPLNTILAVTQPFINIDTSIGVH